MPEEKFIQYGGYDNQGKDVLIFSTTGDRHPVGDFEKALTQYKATGENPSGFIVLPEASVTATIRGGFESVNQPIQRATETINKNISDTLPEPLAAPLNFLTRIPAESVKTPGALGVTVGTALAAPILGPVSTVTGKTGKVVANKATILANALKTAVMGGAGHATMTAMTGDFDIGKTAIESFMAGVGGGASGFIGHFVNKYIKPDMRNQVAKSILEDIKSQYPNLINDPNVIPAYYSNPRNIARLTQQMSTALTGSLDKTTSTLANDISNIVPHTFSVGKQATLRRYARNFNQYANAMLDAENDKALIAAKKGMFETRQQLVDLVKDEFGKSKNLSTVLNNVTQVLQKHRDALDQFEEGAIVLRALRKSGTHKGFDPQKLFMTILGKDEAVPGSLLENVGKSLGFGKSLVEQDQEQQSLGTGMKAVYNMLKGNLPFGLDRVLPSLSSNVQPLLSWQNQRGLPNSVSLPAQLAGQDAIRDYLNKTKR